MYVVLMPGILQKLNELYIEESLPLFKDFLIVHGAVDSAEALDRECYEWYYEQKNAISGAKGKLPDEEAFAIYHAARDFEKLVEFFSVGYTKKIWLLTKAQKKLCRWLLSMRI